MKLQFKHQKFQADAAKAVCDVFAGQPYLTPSYMMDRGYGQQGILDDTDFTGWSNHRIVPELSDGVILEHLQKIQRENQLAPSQKLEGKYNLTIEMETGVGKTYTYIKTMFELNKRYGWSKFIVVVPSIAIREGVYKSFEVTQEHFAEEYGKKIRFFIYNSAQLTEIDRFASDNSINVMIINSQAFNAKGKDARRIYMKLDEFRSRRPIDIIAKTNPILIIDEPQSVEGKQTKERLKEFQPLMTLRYSATHKSDSIYNMVYRLDAMEAYNKRLVKKIAVKGITESGSTATDSYIYLEGINLSKADPTATIQFDCKGTSGVRKITRTVNIGYNLYEQSGGMEEYRNNFIVKNIDGRDDSVEFINGIKIFAGDVIGKVSEEQLRRIQIRETILSHIERERQLFYKGIKVLSLFFIDEVDHYRKYDAAGQQQNGIFAQMFEEEYEDVINNLQITTGEDDYLKYLDSIKASDTHAGYFSIDKKSGHMIDGKLGDKKEKTSDDIDAYAYTGSSQSFNACAGYTYKIEAWGAQGGYYSSSSYGGKGAKAEGKYTFSSATTLYVYVGGDGRNHSGYNGGAAGNDTYKTYGGGATHISTSNNKLSELNSSSTLIAAGGGGGASYFVAGNTTYQRAISTSAAGGAGGQSGSAGSGMSGTILGSYTSATGGGGGTSTSGGSGGSATNSGYYSSCYACGSSGSSSCGTVYGYGGGGGGGWYGGGGGATSMRHTAYDYCSKGASVSKDESNGSFGLGGEAGSLTQSWIEAVATSGGGGGSSYVNTSIYSGSSASYISGTRSGDGYVTITRQY